MKLTPAMIRELRELERIGGGKLRTEDVVEKARDPSSALHGHPAFEWDITKAALKHWMEAARSVIQIFVGIIEDNDGERKEMRTYINVRDDDKTPIYRPTVRVLQENRAVVINSVADRLLSLIKSYPLHEFDPVVELIEQIRATANAPRRGRPPRQPRGGRRPETRARA